MYSNPADYFVKLLARVAYDSESNTRVENFQRLWRVSTSNSSTPIKGSELSTIATASLEETAAWRW